VFSFAAGFSERFAQDMLLSSTLESIGKGDSGKDDEPNGDTKPKSASV